MRAEIVKISSANPEASLIRYAADQIRAHTSPSSQYPENAKANIP